MNDDMLNVMLVDDEENTRNLLKLCIDWHEIGLNIVGEASSGREGLDILEDISPDIIITDIRMPLMDGMVFSELVVERYPNIRIIVLTAHDEFDYAQKGVKLGIADFLLKPIKRSELTETVVSVRDKIKQEQTSKKEYQELKKQIDENYPFLKDKFLNELLQSPYRSDEISEKLHYFSLEDVKHSIQIALIETSESNRVNESEEDGIIFHLLCLKKIKDYFKKDEKIHVFMVSNECVAVLSCDNEVAIINCCMEIKVMLINQLKCYVSIGISNVYSQLGSIKKAYDEASQALKYKVVCGLNQLVSFSDIQIEKYDLSRTDWDKNIDLINKIDFYIKAGLEEDAVELINSIFDEMDWKHNHMVEELQVVAVNIITKILNSISELGLVYADIFKDGKLPYLGALEIGTIEEMKHYLGELIEVIIGDIKNIRANKTNRMIFDITDHLKDNFADPDLSLTGIASKFHMNSSYLSRLFKQEKSVTFVEYLTHLRIKKALEFFNETDLKGYEVAEKVGIVDPKYFGKCFKKYTGVSINEYKKNQ